MSDVPISAQGAPFSKDPSKEQWVGLLHDLSRELAAMELKIHQIKECELPALEDTASDMRGRMDMIVRRVSD